MTRVITLNIYGDFHALNISLSILHAFCQLILTVAARGGYYIVPILHGRKSRQGNSAQERERLEKPGTRDSWGVLQVVWCCLCSAEKDLVADKGIVVITKKISSGKCSCHFFLFSQLKKKFIYIQIQLIKLPMESTESSYEFENETSREFSIWRFSLQGHSLDTFPKEIFNKRLPMSLTVPFQSNNSLDFMETENNRRGSSRMTRSHWRVLPKSWHFSVLLKPTPCGHMKGLSIWEILLPNH